MTLTIPNGADGYLRDIARVPDEIIPDNMTVTASDATCIIKFHRAGLSKDDIREIMEAMYILMQSTGLTKRSRI